MNILSSNRLTSLSVVVLVLLLIGGGSTSAFYFADTIEKGADIIITEVRIPFWSESTYYSFFSSSMIPQGGGFYGGITISNPDKSEPHMIWTYWPDRRCGGRLATPEYVNELFHAQQHVGEGASGKVSSQTLPWLKSGVWYRCVMRAWPADDSTVDDGFAGWWMRDESTGVWRHLATMRLPARVSGFANNGGFLEDFSHGNRHQRAIELRGNYCRFGGQWKSADKRYFDDAGQLDAAGKPMFFENARLIDNDTAFHYDTSCDPADGGNIPQRGERFSLVCKQPAEPSFDPIHFTASATMAGSQLVVRWDVPLTSSPQFGYEISVTRTDASEDEPIALLRRHTPQQRMARLDLPAGAVDARRLRVKLTLIDIFDRETSLQVQPTGVEKIMSAVRPLQVTPGLSYAYYESPTANRWGTDNWSKLPDFAALSPIQRGAVQAMDTTLHRRFHAFGMMYRGYLKVPADGQYLFYLRSCDGSRLTLGDQVVVDHDESHGSTEKVGSIALRAGLHPLQLEYFSNHQQVDTMLQLEWEGPGFTRQLVSPELFVRDLPANEPRIHFASLQPSKTYATDGVLVVPSIESHGQSIDHVDYLLNNILWETVDATPFGLSLRPGVGWNVLRARLFYDANHTVDSPAVAFTVNPPDLGRWQWRTLGDHSQPLMLTGDDHHMQFTGNGFNFAWQQVRGDFSLTARVDHITPARELNGFVWAYVGLAVRSTVDGDWKQGQFAHLCYATDQKILTQTRRDVGLGGWVKQSDDGDKLRWLRLTREGQTITAALSADGQTWQPIKGFATVDGKLPESAYVGVCTQFVPHPNMPRFDATLAEIQIQSSKP